MRLGTHIYDKRGMSLIEVLAALAVFVIGILVIVRLFPPGFFVIKQSENFTLANRLAQSELERLKGTTANLPAGILGWDIVSGSVLIDMNPENMDDLPGLTSENPYYYSDVNKFRRIYSESTRIPAPMTTPNWGDVSLYVMNFSPVEWNGPPSIVVRSGPMRRRDVPESPSTIRSSSDYAIDYDKAELHVRPYSDPREFIITYSYWAKPGARPELRPVLSAHVLVPPNKSTVDIPDADPTPAPIRSKPGFMGIDQGSDTLHRAFDQIPVTTAFSANPYEYKVLDQFRGVLGFNPAGHGYDEVTAWGTVALTAYIDYDVLDWHIIREERKIPETALITSQADLDAKLTLRFIKNAGLTNVANPGYPTTVELDGSNYAGLSSGLPFSILAIDIQTGEWFNEESHVPAPGNTNNFVMTVNYKDGVIRFDRDMAGRTFRIYYRAEGDWALQVFKTYESYRRSYSFNANSPTPLDHREWWGPESTASDSVPYLNDKIYFARCYSGMSVALDYTYRIKAGGGYTYFNVAGDNYQTSTATGFTGTCYIEPRERIARLRAVSVSDVEITEVAKVYGVSVGTRVIWREGGRGFNGGQWRKVDLQTYLMRLQD